MPDELLLVLPASFNFNPDDQYSYSSGIWEVAIYVANKFAASKVDFPDCNLLDCICVSLKLHGHNSLFIACVYRSPSSPLQFSSEHICQFLQKASTYSHLLVCGDVYDIDVFTLSTGTALSIGCPSEFFGWPSRDARSAFKAWVRPRGEPDPS